MTNAHVVGQSPSEVQIAFAGHAFRPARKLYVDPFADIAVITADGIEPSRAAAQLDCGGPPKVGDPVGAFGHPLGMPFTGTRGIVSGLTDQDGPDLIQIDATVDHGNSGGPVIALRNRQVVGIATAMAGGSRADRLNFATPIKDVCRILAFLRQGVSPAPPRMEFALLKDEDGRHTMRVARTFDSTRWPLLPGDRIVAVPGTKDSIKTLSDLVGALRGRTGRVPLTVERDGRPLEVVASPLMQPAVTERRGISVDGALIAPIRFDDEANLSEPMSLVVQSVEPASAAEALGVQGLDIIESLDGRRFEDLGALNEYFRQHPQGTPVTVVLRRFSASSSRIFEYHVRDLPGQDIHAVEPEPQLVTAHQ